MTVSKVCPFAYHKWMGNKYAAITTRDYDDTDSQLAYKNNVIRTCPCLEKACEAWDPGSYICLLIER